MPCPACADRVLGIFLQKAISLNVGHAASRVPQASQQRWFSAQRRAIPQSHQISTRSPATAPITPKIDIYVPFDGDLTASKSSSLQQKTSHLEHVFAELSPDSVDVIPAGAAPDKSTHTAPSTDYDENEIESEKRSPKKVAQNGGQVGLGVASATEPNGMGSHIAKGVRQKAEPWQIQKDALRAKFGSSGWNPRKRLSPDALDGIRALNAQFPDKYTTPILAELFKVSPEAIRRVLKSKWQPSDEETERRRGRWVRRGEKIWGRMVELGVKPPKKWREMGVGKGNIKDPRLEKLGRRHRSERDPRRTWSAESGGREKADHDDWDEQTLAERIL
ncbi:hypothetical protein GP486_001383 [Trichoglossum hirsutum]|uniref:Required for respiratory growth protein 9, mitochondrial n=1 Tax=Trichoglossum hirsutum TaxID=265104 RepID=A0A9P8LGS0_9PEZI|nr:hypothetical protein GP486_001383 [Trichoglossum hirsutum]